MFGLTDEDMVRMQREMFSDRQYDALLETAAEATSAAAAPSIGGGSDLGGGPAPDLGGDLGGGTSDPLATGDPAASTDPLASPPGDTPPAGGAPAGGAPAGDAPAPEGGLLAEPPGKRDEDNFKWIHPDNRTETSKSKGKKYLPVKFSNLPFDKRETGGARKNNRNGQTGSNTSRANKHNVFKGYSNLKSISRGVMEEKDSSYLKEEEEKIFDTNSDVRKIIESLNLRSKNETQT
jgi:hypothetical protein